MMREDSTSSLEGVNSDEGKGIDRPTQFVATTDPAATTRMTEHPTLSDYTAGAPMESAYYFQPNFVPQMTNETLGLEDVRQYSNSWSFAADDSQSSSSVSAYRWDWQGC